MSYKVTLENSGTKYKAEGKTLSEALGNLKVGWEEIKLKSILKITKGKAKYTHLFSNMAQMRRILANKVAREVWSKRLEMLLKSEKDINI